MRTVTFLAIMALVSSINAMAPQVGSESFIREIMTTERGPVESDYIPISSDEYEESPWFALRILLPIKRNSTWEYSAGIARTVSLEFISDFFQDDPKLKFLFELKNCRPDISLSQLATVYVLIDSITDEDGQELFTDAVLDDYWAIMCNGMADRTINPITRFIKPFVREIMAANQTDGVSPFFLNVVAAIDLGDTEFTSYQTAFDVVSKNYPLSLPFVHGLLGIPRRMANYMSKNSRGAINVTGRVVVRTGETVLNSAATAFGATVGAGLGVKALGRTPGGQ